MLDKNGNAIIDYERIYKICLLNAFTSGEPVTYDSKNNDVKTGTGLWIKSSHFNHSCVPNTTGYFMGDVMVRQTSRFIKAGEELTLAQTHGQNENQKKQLAKYGFTCQCPLCLLERQGDSTGLQNTLKELDQTFRESFLPRAKNKDPRVIHMLEGHIAKVKQVCFIRYFAVINSKIYKYTTETNTQKGI